VFWSSVYDISWYNQATSPESRCFGDTRYLYVYRYGISWYNQHARWKAGVLGIRENYIIVQSARAATSDIIGQSARLAGKQVFWEYVCVGHPCTCIIVPVQSGRSHVGYHWTISTPRRKVGVLLYNQPAATSDIIVPVQSVRLAGKQVFWVSCTWYHVQSARSHVGYHSTISTGTPRRKAGVWAYVYGIQSAGSHVAFMVQSARSHVGLYRVTEDWQTSTDVVLRVANTAL
jgi:hypothetical protein